MYTIHTICSFYIIYLINCMLEYSTVVFLYSKAFLVCRFLPVVFSRPAISALSNKVSHDLTFIWWMSRAMDNTSEFWSFLRIIYIPFSALSRALTHLVVGIWRGGLSFHFPAETSTVGIFPSIFFIRIFYNTLINRFFYFRAFKHVYRLFKEMGSPSNPCTYAHLIQLFGILFNKIPFNSVSQFFTWLYSREHSQIIVKINHTSRVASYF